MDVSCLPVPSKEQKTDSGNRIAHGYAKGRGIQIGEELVGHNNI
jgi:hypothetical protein